MLLQDMQLPAIKAAIGKEITQTALSIAIAGTSGAGMRALTHTLFPNLVSRGFLSMRKQGNAKYYTATQKGIDSVKE